MVAETRQTRELLVKKMLDVEHVFVSYETQTVLRDINLNVKAGEILAVIGPNGVGKSTLIRALSGILPLVSGKISVSGKDISRLKPAEKARLIAVVPQVHTLPPAFTGYELVRLGRTPHLGWLGNFSESDEEISRSAMRRTHTLELAERKVGEISGGEQQRLLLARALAQGTPVLMLDEPTLHLDLNYQISFLDHVQALARQDNLTVVITLHDLNLVSRYADRVALLVNEKLLACGTPREVLKPDLLSNAYQLPLHTISDPHTGLEVILP